MATMQRPDLPSPHLLIPLPDPVVDRPPFLHRPDEVLIERSLPSACLLCRGRCSVEIRPAGDYGTPLTMPCPHCQQHIPLRLVYLPTGGSDARPDAVPDRQPAGEHVR